MQKTFRIISSFFFCCFLSDTLPAQQNVQNSLDSFSGKFITNIRSQSRPQAFITTDKSMYIAGENIWFNALVLNSVSQKVSTKGKYVFVDMVNDQDSVITSVLLDAANQQLSSKIVIPDPLPAGYYWLRAYTMQMILSDSDYCDVKPIYVFNAGIDAGSKPPRSKNKTNISSNIPIFTFFPEGGSVITGANSVIAFLLHDDTGKPLSIEGAIKDNRDSVVTRFNSGKNGLGKFDFEPARVRQYKAFITWKGKEISYPLPAFNFKAGRISVVSGTNGSRLFRVLLEDSIYSNNFLSYVIGIAKDSLCFASIGKGQYEFAIPDYKFPAGITTFYLLDSNFNVLSERSIYARENNVMINASVDKNSVATNTPVSLSFSLSGKNKSPVSSLFALAVADSTFTDPYDVCMMPDVAERNKKEIFNNTFLARLSCLYNDELDLLMLLNNKTFETIQHKTFKPSPVGTDSILDIQGTVLNEKNQPLINTVVTLLSNSGTGVFATDTTDSKGRFYFAVEGYRDSTQFSLNAKGAAGKKQLRFVVDPFKWPVFKTPSYLKQHILPEPSLGRYKTAYIDPEVATPSKKLPVVRLNSKTNYDATKRVSQYSTIITSDEIPEGGNVGNAVLGTAGIRLSQGYLVIGGPNTMEAPSFLSEPLIIFNGAQAPLSAGSGVGDMSPSLAFLNSLNGREIDFIEILKGADAANYGVRGGNGVILVNMATSRKDNVSAGIGSTVFYARGISNSPIFPIINPQQIKASSVTLNNRSTIFWDGSVFTNNSDVKTFTFYTSNIPATYKVTLSGITSQGDVIYKTFTFKSK